MTRHFERAHGAVSTSAIRDETHHFSNPESTKVFLLKTLGYHFITWLPVEP